MKVALVAGGAGFLGTHLCEQLLKEGYRVICVDNLSTGRDSNNTRLLRKYPHEFIFIQHDISESMREIFHDESIDEIYNLACPASPEKYQSDELQTLNTNYLGTQNLLQLAIAKRARVLHTSTSEIYGDPLEHPQQEQYRGNTNTVGPRSCYDEGKRVAETLCRTFYFQFHVDVRVVRIFNTYGPYMDPADGRVISNFINQAQSGKPLTVYGDGTQTRSLCYVSDLIAGFRAFMQLPVWPLEADRGSKDLQVLNLGNPSEISIVQLAVLIRDKFGSKNPIEHLEPLTDDPKLRCPDITRAKAVLGWEPRVSLAEGLERTGEYFKMCRQLSEVNQHRFIVPAQIKAGAAQSAGPATDNLAP